MCRRAAGSPNAGSPPLDGSAHDCVLSASTPLPVGRVGVMSSSELSGRGGRFETCEAGLSSEDSEDSSNSVSSMRPCATRSLMLQRVRRESSSKSMYTVPFRLDFHPDAGWNVHLNRGFVDSQPSVSKKLLFTSNSRSCPWMRYRAVTAGFVLSKTVHSRQAR